MEIASQCIRSLTGGFTENQGTHLVSALEGDERVYTGRKAEFCSRRVGESSESEWAYVENEWAQAERA